MHPTQNRLLETTLHLLKTVRHEDITADLVLRTSGVSKGSLYHHFADFSDLMETALTELFAESVDANREIMSKIVSSAKSSGECFRMLSEVTRNTQSSDMFVLRARRAGVLASCANNSRLAEKVSVAQERLTRHYTKLFSVLQARGWMNTDFSPHAAAILIQSYTIGKIVDDISSDPVDSEEWVRLIDSIVINVFGLKPD